MELRSFLVLSPIFLAESASAIVLTSSCPAPIQLPITNVTIANNLVRRGVALSVGGQQFSFQANPATANLYLRTKVNDCTSDSANVCIAQTGGLFDTSKSSTFTSGPNRQSVNGSAELSPNPNTYPTAGWGTDVVNGTYRVPVGLDTNRGDLGLNQNSSFLSYLKSSAVIPSSSYGLWQGFYGNLSDGSLVLGGYDQGKVLGDGLTLPLNTTGGLESSGGCRSGLVLNVTFTGVQLRDGRSESGFSVNDKTWFLACIDPSVDDLLLPYDLATSLYSFLNLTTSTAGSAPSGSV